MRVHLGSDHAGLELKAQLVTWLESVGHEPVDHGPFHHDALDDYPPFCLRAAAAVVADRARGEPSLGVVIGGSGNGEQIAANKVAGVRAALAWNEEVATLARQHNDANVISVGARMHTSREAARLVEVFLETGYLDEERHARRIRMIADYETTGELPPLPPSGSRPTPTSPDA
ncbi:MAG: Ribose 5-phosphate isomerase B / Galactose 6-phosphate isomerase [uncultured Nocardioidaceae bacterium]|uniref:Ribose-5-phosphate isomerase B n=1 Tax=uncultured Nocardioidaceae bacterium TaxID=253824 RepID=A0A6J4MJP9_9ACTN|nr:MAG: Ribose 5-phosphate isomerase B / Galactose 6-phosphate isomerase [uncultured Nocardioidaceae bacterium]